MVFVVLRSEEELAGSMFSSPLTVGGRSSSESRGMAGWYGCNRSCFLLPLFFARYMEFELQSQSGTHCILYPTQIKLTENKSRNI